MVAQEETSKSGAKVSEILAFSWASDFEERVKPVIKIVMSNKVIFVCLVIFVGLSTVL